jgi:hypothetical protein
MVTQTGISAAAAERERNFARTTTHTHTHTESAHSQCIEERESKCGGLLLASASNSNNNKSNIITTHPSCRIPFKLFGYGLRCGGSSSSRSAPPAAGTTTLPGPPVFKMACNNNDVKTVNTIRPNKTLFRLAIMLCWPGGRASGCVRRVAQDATAHHMNAPCLVALTPHTVALHLAAKFVPTSKCAKTKSSPHNVCHRKVNLIRLRTSRANLTNKKCDKLGLGFLQICQKHSFNMLHAEKT